MNPRKLQLLLLAWMASFALALFCAAIVVKGVLRDLRVGEPMLAIDLSRPSDWTATRFRVWGQGTYMLFISSVNWDSTYVGAPLGAELEVAVLDPGGRPVFERVFPGGATGHVLPINYGDSRLVEVPVDDWPLRRWTLKARVLAPDERFKTARSSVKFWKQRYDPGMGGMMNYVMIVPAGVFMLLAFFAALSLFRHGRRAPIVVTVAAGVLLLVFVGT